MPASAPGAAQGGLPLVRGLLRGRGRSAEACRVRQHRADEIKRIDARSSRAADRGQRPARALHTRRRRPALGRRAKVPPPRALKGGATAVLERRGHPRWLRAATLRDVQDLGWIGRRRCALGIQIQKLHQQRERRVERWEARRYGARRIAHAARGALDGARALPVVVLAGARLVGARLAGLVLVSAARGGVGERGLPDEEREHQGAEQAQRDRRSQSTRASPSVSHRALRTLLDPALRGYPHHSMTNVHERPPRFRVGADGSSSAFASGRHFRATPTRMPRSKSEG